VTPSKPDSPRCSVIGLVVVEMEVTVDIGCMDSIAHDWLRRASVYSHIVPSDGLKNSSRIEGSLFEGSIAMYCGYTEELNTGIMCAYQESIGILDVAGHSEELW